MQEFLPSLRHEIPNFDLPAMEPYAAEWFQFRFKNDYVMNGISNLTNVRTHGITRAKVRSIKSDFQNGQMKLEIGVFFNKLYSTGNYSSRFVLSSFLTFNSKGTYKISLKDVYSKWTIRGKLENVNGEDFMKVYQFDVDPEANDIKIYFSGLTPDENLSE